LRMRGPGPVRWDARILGGSNTNTYDIRHKLGIVATSCRGAEPPGRLARGPAGWRVNVVANFRRARVYDHN
jgi:hypothetical protein